MRFSTSSYFLLGCIVLSVLPVLFSGACRRDAEPAFADRSAIGIGDTEAVSTPEPSIRAGLTAVGLEVDEVTYGTAEGTSLRGYLAQPQSAALAPTVIVIHPWWGLNAQIESRVRQLAAAGFNALAVDLNGGRVALNREGAQVLSAAVQAHQPAVEENLRQALAYIGHKAVGNRGSEVGEQGKEGEQDDDGEQGADGEKADSGEKGDADDQTVAGAGVGVIGWGLGSTWALRTALALPDQVNALVLYYGQPVMDEERLMALNMPILGFYGAADDGLSVSAVRDFEELLLALNKEVSISLYAEAGEGFANPIDDHYQAFAAEDAWAKTLAFLREHLTVAAGS